MMCFHLEARPLAGNFPWTFSEYNLCAGVNLCYSTQLLVKMTMCDEKKDPFLGTLESKLFWSVDKFWIVRSYILSFCQTLNIY